MGNVLAKDDNAPNASFRGPPGMDLPAQPMHRKILANEAVLLAIEVFAGQRTAMQVFPSLRDFRKEFVVRAADDVDRTEAIVLTPAAADREVPHLAIEHGQRRRGMFDEEPEDH